MKRFFTHIFQAISELQFYHSVVPRMRLRTALGQYLLFLGIISVVSAAHWIVFRQEGLRADLSDSLTQLVESVPAELSLTWNGKQLSSTPPTVGIPYPAVWEIDPAELAVPEQLLIIGSDEESAASSFITLSPTEVHFWQSEGEPHTEQLAHLLGSESWTLTRADIQNTLPQLQAILTQGVTLLSWSLPVIFFVGLVIKRLLQALIAAVLVSFVSGVTGQRISVEHAFKLLLWLFVPAEILTLTHTLLAPDGYTGVFSLAVLTYYLFYVWSKPSTVQST